MVAITKRIAYYVGDGDGDTSDGDRSQRYSELDVLNEALREGTYWKIFRAQGVAQIYKNVQDAVTAAAPTRGCIPTNTTSSIMRTIQTEVRPTTTLIGIAETLRPSIAPGSVKW